MAQPGCADGDSARAAVDEPRLGIRRRGRDLLISVFVVVWIAVFQYESLRLNYLAPLVGQELPKLKFLYPPAGWIMFFNIDRSYGFAQVYGIRQGKAVEIDPHAIFETRFVGYDNIRRNVLISVLSPSHGPSFCAYLHRKFPEYDGFAVVYSLYPDVVDHPDDIRSQLAYQCR